MIIIIIIIIIISSFEKVKGAVGDCKVILRTKFRWWRPKIICFKGPGPGPFLERPGNFSGLKSNIQIEIKRIRARVPARKLLHFVSLTDGFIMLDAKLLKPRSLM